MGGTVIDINSYKERRKKFLNSVEYKPVPNRNRDNKGRSDTIQLPKVNDRGKNDVIQVPDLERFYREKNEAQTSSNEKNKEKREAQTSLHENKKVTKRRTKAQIMRNRAILAGLAGILVFGGVKKWKEYRDSKNTLTLEQAFENGKTPEDLGISEEIAREIEKYRTMLEGDLTNEELIEIADKIPYIQKSVIKEKISHEIGDINTWNITVIPAYQDDPAIMSIAGQGIYEKQGLINLGLGNKIISDGIVDYIDRIGVAQEKEAEIKNGSINKERDVKYYRKEIKEISKFAAGEIEIDEKGNISIEKTRVSELEKAKEEAKEKDEGFEIDD